MLQKIFTNDSGILFRDLIVSLDRSGTVSNNLKVPGGFSDDCWRDVLNPYDSNRHSVCSRTNLDSGRNSFAGLLADDVAAVWIRDGKRMHSPFNLESDLWNYNACD